MSEDEILKLIKSNEQKRKTRRIEDLAVLQKHSIDFDTKWDNSVHIETPNFWIWYYPDTGEWADRKNLVSNFGVNTLLEYLRSWYGK